MNNQIHIAGVTHPDPLGRIRLRDWLTQLKIQLHAPPNYVAVEWDEEIFRDVKSQRLKLRKLVKAEWPNAPKEFVDDLVLAMGYDADSHIDIFPEAATLWLDNGRTVDDPTVITNYSEDRMSSYRNMFDPSLESFSNDQLRKMSDASWRSIGDSPPEERDNLFANRILRILKHDSYIPVIVIVGVGHTQQEPGYMRAILEKMGYGCHVVEMRSS